MRLASAKKLAYGRCEEPENTIRRLEPVIRRLHEYTLVEEKVSERLYWSALFIDELEFRSMGKGVSAAFSKAGALAEAAEWLTARQPGALPGYVPGSQDDVENPLKIEDLLSHVSTATDPVLQKVKQSDGAQHWADGSSLLDGRPLKVPIQFIRRINGPNGLASGNRLEEAIVHATNEIFERRAHATVLKNRMVMPTIDPDTIEDPVIGEQIRFIRDQGIEVTVKDLSFGGVLPCVGAYFCDPNVPDTHQFHHFFKVGASFNTKDALSRVFTEYTQGRRVDEFIDGSREEQERILNYDFRSLACIDDDGDNLLSSFLFGFVPFTHAPFLTEGELVPFDPGECFDDCLQDIGRAADICRMLGKDYLAVDFTDPKIGFPVVQVIIPGYSDVLPYHPASSRILFRDITRQTVIDSYEKVKVDTSQEDGA